MLKNVDLPAPLGPMSARISPRASANETPSTAWTPPNARRTSSTWRTAVGSVTGTRAERAENAARKREHEDDEDRAQHELPVLRVPRHHGVEELVDRRTERRAGQRVYAAEQHHHQRLDRHRHRERLRKDAAFEKHYDAAGEAAEHAGDDERQPMMCAHVDAHSLRAARMVTRRAKRQPERRAPDRGEHRQTGATCDERDVVVAHRRRNRSRGP